MKGVLKMKSFEIIDVATGNRIKGGYPTWEIAERYRYQLLKKQDGPVDWAVREYVRVLPQSKG